MPSMKQVRLLPLPVGGGAGVNSEGSLSNPEDLCGSHYSTGFISGTWP